MPHITGMSSEPRELAYEIACLSAEDFAELSQVLRKPQVSLTEVDREVIQRLLDTDDLDRVYLAYSAVTKGTRWRPRR